MVDRKSRKRRRVVAIVETPAERQIALVAEAAKARAESDDRAS
jgi:hypothetical protein